MVLSLGLLSACRDCSSVCPDYGLRALLRPPEPVDSLLEMASEPPSLPLSAHVLPVEPTCARTPEAGLCLQAPPGAPVGGSRTGIWPSQSQ